MERREEEKRRRTWKERRKSVSDLPLSRRLATRHVIRPGGSPDTPRRASLGCGAAASIIDRLVLTSIAVTSCYLSSLPCSSTPFCYLYLHSAALEASPLALETKKKKKNIRQTSSHQPITVPYIFVLYYIGASG